MAITTAMRTEVSQLYVALFGRAPDGDGLGFWVQLRDQGQTMAQLANTMYATTPARTYFPSFLTNTEIISAFYVNVLGRTADADGLAFWTGKLNAAGATPGSVIAEMISVVANYTGTDAAGVVSKDLFNNKVSVAQYYGEKNGNVAGATSVLAGVTNVAATVTTAKAAVDSGAIGGVNQGQTFTLTANTDVVNGTAGNDTFIAGDVGGKASLTAGDTISGGAGTDRLNLVNAAGADNMAAFATATVTGVEQVYATAEATGKALNVAGNADVKEAWLTKGFDSTVTATLAQTVGLQGAINTNTATITVTFNGAGGTADAATLALDGANLITTTAAAAKGVTIAAIESLTIAANGTNNIDDLTAAAAATVKVTGTGTLSTVIASTVTKTIDASANTGGVKIDNSAAAAAVQAITGTAAADEYTTKFADLTKDDKIDLGAGADVLAFADATDLSDATKAAVLGGTTNVEGLKVNGTGTFKADGDALSQSLFIVNTIGAFTGTTFGSTDSLQVDAVAMAASTVGMKLGQNTFNLALVGSKDAISDAVNGISVTGASTLNISSAGSVDQGANKLLVKTDDNGTLKITGAKDLTLTTNLTTGTTGLSIDASAFTGKLDVTGTAVADLIVGGTGADTIRAFGNGIDTLTGGAGKDKFVVFGADADTALTAVQDTITDFVSGTDSLGGFGTAGSATNYLEATTVAATLTALTATANTALDGTIKYYVGQVGSDSYVFFDDNGTALTTIVKLTGVALDGIAQADIVA